MLVAVFCIAVAVGLFAALASFSDVWFHRTDPAGRGLALCGYAVSVRGWRLTR